MNLRNRLYFQEKIAFRNGEHRIETLPDGCLYSDVYPTKIKPNDLPEWYLFGRYYKQFGYLSAKGITDMLYIPSRFSNHFLKDDCLLISYGGKITTINDKAIILNEKYSGADERVFGSEIVTMLRGARKYSEYDITSFITALKEKLKWCLDTFPDDTAADSWKQMDVDRMFAETEFYRPNK